MLLSGDSSASEDGFMFFISRNGTFGDSIFLFFPVTRGEERSVAFGDFLAYGIAVMSDVAIL